MTLVRDTDGCLHRVESAGENGIYYSAPDSDSTYYCSWNQAHDWFEPVERDCDV